MLLPISSYAETPPFAKSAEFHDEALSGQPSGVIVMNEPCIHGDAQHYEINSDAEFRIYDHQTCGRLGATGGMMVCFMGPQLKCVSREGPNPTTKLSSDVWYSLSENGVTVGSNIYPWANAEHAHSLFPAIQKKAEERCNEVLFWQLTYKNWKKAPPSTGFQIDGILAEETCKPMLDSLCTLAKNGVVKLTNGKDISGLCH